jgi:hypothetical protein
METVTINNHPNLQRDLHSKAILNTNRQAIDKYNRESKMATIHKQKIDDVDILKKEMQDMKNMLMIILQKLGE